MLASDACATVAALFTALAISTTWPADAPPGGVGLVQAGLLIAICLSTSMVAGVAQTRIRDTFETASMRRLIWLSIAMTIGSMAVIDLDAGFHAAFGMSFFLTALAARLALYETLTALYRIAPDVRRVLIYGAGTTGVQMAAALRRHERIEPVAFIDDNAALHGVTMAGLRVHSPSRIAEIAAERDVRRVILAMPSQPLPQRQMIANRLSEMGFEVLALPSFAQLVGEELGPERLEAFGPNDVLDRKRELSDRQHLDVAYRGRSVLVSGAGGTIGSELCRQIMAHAPRSIVLFEISEPALFNVQRDLERAFRGTDTQIVPVLGSIADARLVREVLTRHEIEVVLHAAAYKHVPLVEQNGLAGLANNVLGTQTLASEAAAAGVDRFILISSDKAVRPANVMGATKRMAELVLQDQTARSNGTRFACVRFGNVLGSSGSVIPVFREQIASGGPLTLTHRDATRYFMSVEEAVHLVLVAGAHASGGEVFVLDMGEPVRIVDLARKMIEAAGYRLKDRDHPEGDIEIVEIGLRPGERIHEESVVEGARPTPHRSILVIEPPRLSEFEVAAMLRAIRDAVANGQSETIPGILERYIPDYRPAPLAEARPKSALSQAVSAGADARPQPPCAE